jgi:hypothetical protein
MGLYVRRLQRTFGGRGRVMYQGFPEANDILRMRGDK